MHEQESNSAPNPLPMFELGQDKINNHPRTIHVFVFFFTLVAMATRILIRTEIFEQV